MRACIRSIITGRTCRWRWALLALLLPLAANAAEYKLAFGGRYALCRDLQRNLTTFNSAEPMVCGIRFRPRFKKFWLPDWQSMDVRENLGLLKRTYIVQNLHRGGYTPKKSAREWDKNKPRLLKKIEQGKVHLWRARFDFDNDGDLETVFMLADYGCDPTDPAQFVVPPEPTLYIGGARPGILDHRYARVGSAAYDPFFYQGRTFLSKWGYKGGSGNDGVLYVYEPGMPTPPGLGLSLSLVCKYDYLR